MVLTDFIKFCKDFEIPLSRTNQMEVFRKVVIKQNLTVNFEIFLEILKELFFVKETEHKIQIKQNELETDVTLPRDKRQ